jgi:hypothetical protein
VVAINKAEYNIKTMIMKTIQGERCELYRVPVEKGTVERIPVQPEKGPAIPAIPAMPAKCEPILFVEVYSCYLVIYHHCIKVSTAYREIAIVHTSFNPISISV